MKKAIATLLVSILLLSALPFGVSAGGVRETAGKRDYAGLISRKDKYELYVSGSDESGLWGHHVYQKQYGGIFGYPALLIRYMDEATVGKYYADDYLKNTTPLYDEFMKYYKTEAEKTRMPDFYYFVLFENVNREQFEKAMKKVFELLDLPYGDWVADAVYSNDPDVLKDTFLSPELVVNTDFQDSTSTETQYEGMGLLCPWPGEVINIPLTVLDGWNYSDEYWLDYYQFVALMTDIRLRKGCVDSVVTSGGVGEDGISELARRLALYSERVGKSPDTGDAGGARVAFLAATTVLAAIIPAGVLTVWRRRNRKL